MADDKFILMGLDDEISGYVAEVLKNPTCKKILNLLGDVKEASEKDIADLLKIPINTVEYNINKLIKSRLVEKTKNFFWSVKGKKIPMYKLARKYIIISPNKKPNLSYVKSILPFILIAIALVGLVALLMLQENEVVGDQTQLKQFKSYSELKNFIKENSETSGFFEEIFGVARAGVMEATTSEVAEASSGTAAADYSKTNIQVEGVDEADIVKNDGKYIYVVSGKKIIIVNAYPPENMEILSEIEFAEYISEIFINEDKLVVFSYEDIYIYDILDRENPELENEIESNGNYVDSRMIGDYVYVISTKYVNVGNPELPIYEVNGVNKKVSAQEVYYWPYPDASYVFTSIIAINVNSGDFNSEVYLTGGTSTLYISQDNIYLTYQKTINYKNYAEQIAEGVYFPLLPDKYDKEIEEILDSNKDGWKKLSEMQNIVDEYAKDLEPKEMVEFSDELLEKLEEFETDIQKQIEKTIIHKINVDEENIEYIGVGEVSGMVLNQFSIDEYDGYFRIATTTSFGDKSLNHLYVLDEDLKIVGSIEDLAKGERIYSARFLGKRAYLVTFRQIDPFYVVDLSEPRKPKILGYLKIPGYSSYLHSYDENHVIGLGKDGRNLKLSLFDVSDVENPEEIDEYTVEGEYSDSNALYEHKAFLFDKKKELLVIPADYNEIIGIEVTPGYEYEKYKYWQGAFVLNINIEGFELRGKISHYLDSEGDERFYQARVQRILYMDDVLYTISEKKIKANDLQTINEINSVDLPYENDYPVYGSNVIKGSSGVEEIIEND